MPDRLYGTSALPGGRGQVQIFLQSVLDCSDIHGLDSHQLHRALLEHRWAVSYDGGRECTPGYCKSVDRWDYWHILCPR